jgi:hypothetical protein
VNLLSLLPSLKGGLIVGAVCLAIGATGGWKARDLVAEGDRADREAAYAQGLQLINAANDAAAALAAEDARRALAAAEAAAAEAQARAAELAGQVEAIRAIPDAENCPLGLETMKILEGLM